MTERSNFGYPPMNSVYATAQWNGANQPSSRYSPPAAYYPASPYSTSQASGNRSTHIPYSPPKGPTSSLMGQSAQYAYPPNTHRPNPPTQQQQMFTHPAPQPIPSRESVAQSRSHPMHDYIPSNASHSPPMMASLPHSPSQYHPQMAYGQSMGNGMQYPASPNRPFSCDMCALSFNRQHDLKRHRETHSGEKPFLCNGGCGKTFTRKDALKRHQV